MFKPYSVFRYLIVLFAITYQSQAFCIETDSKSNPQAMSNLKEYGLDKRVKIMGAILLIFAPLGLMAYNKNKQGTLGKESQINILERKITPKNKENKTRTVTAPSNPSSSAIRAKIKSV